MDELMPHADRHELSDAGEARRDRILERALAAQRWRVRRRRSVQGAGGALAVVAVVLAARTSIAPPAAAPSGTTDPIAHAPRDPAPAARPRVEIVSTSHADYERLTARGDAGAVDVIGDEELLELLRGAGRPAGIVRVQGRVEVVGDVGAVVPAARDDATSG